MGTCRIMVMLIVLGLLYSPVCIAEPYAPLVKLNPKGKELMKLGGKTEADRLRDVPSKTEVGAPPYPGALLASAVKVNSGDMLPAVNLVSNDPPEKVREWYRENLHGWSWDNTYKLFYQGEGKLDVSEMFQTPVVTISDEEGDGLDLMFSDVPGVKTRIQITYKPKKRK